MAAAAAAAARGVSEGCCDCKLFTFILTATFRKTQPAKTCTLKRGGVSLCPTVPCRVPNCSQFYFEVYWRARSRVRAFWVTRPVPRTRRRERFDTARRLHWMPRGFASLPKSVIREPSGGGRPPRARGAHAKSFSPLPQPVGKPPPS